MRIALLLLVFLPNFLASQTHPCPDALFRYWEFKDRLHKHFVRLDWWGDGIGQWDAEKMRYEKAGYGLPAAQLYTIPKSCFHDGYHADCVYPADMLVNCDVPNVLTWGADSPAYLGHYLALLATEFELLQRKGQVEAARKTLHELWLALQAYRRLDMSANQHYAAWIQENDPDCLVAQNLGACGNSYPEPQFDGYSGFFLRNDVPSEIRHHFNAQADGDEAWEVGGVTSSFGCGEADPLGYFLPNADDRRGNNIFSQDQMIGMLFGLAFVKKYIPDTATVLGQRPVEMSEKIAAGFLNHIQLSDELVENYRSIRYPGCLDHLKVEIGGNVSNFFLAINLAVAAIAPDAKVCTDGVDNQKWTAFGKKACNCNLPFYGNCGFNCRMLLALMAIGDEGDFKKMQKKATEIGKEAYVLAWHLLHPDKHLTTDILPLVKLGMEEAVFENPPSCHGPCFRLPIAAGPYFECPNVNGWCATHRLLAGDIDRVFCNYNTLTPRRGNGLDFLLMHNLYLLTYFPDAPFFNPENPEGEVAFLLPSVFEGERSVCPSGNTELAVPDDLQPFETIRWKVSPNLNLSYLDASKSTIEISAENETDTLGWVQVVVLRNGCERTYSWSKIRIGLPPVPLLEDRSEGCRHTVGLKNPHADLFRIDWEMPSLQPENFEMEQHETQADFSFFLPPPVETQVLVSLENSCGTTTAERTFRFECDDELLKRLHVFPNPASNELHLEFQNLSPHILYHEPAKVRIYDRLSRYLLAETTDRNAWSLDISDLRSGLYFVQVVIEGDVYAARFVKN